MEQAIGNRVEGVQGGGDGGIAIIQGRRDLATSQGWQGEIQQSTVADGRQVKGRARIFL
jgi:hypothetical protein